ncbi:hypothetical protein H920_05911 [Fukomys damarensis]|uniref:Uncharacterized protein n=1 Tax=Fukomys damarensis TaxID=885580 RepID=A0A091DNW5_FUKDA|nr:hypothetical protein H920_05911 [Fukomys damarensis]
MVQCEQDGVLKLQEQIIVRESHGFVAMTLSQQKRHQQTREFGKQLQEVGCACLHMCTHMKFVSKRNSGIANGDMHLGTEADDHLVGDRILNKPVTGTWEGLRCLDPT